MTKRKAPRIAPVVSSDDLLEHIAGLLAVAPRKVVDLADITGYSDVTIRWRLYALEIDERAHQVIVHTKANNISRVIVWHAGPHLGPGPAVRSFRPGRRSFGEPNQTTTKSFPAIGRRDYMVAALFGAAGGQP